MAPISAQNPEAEIRDAGIIGLVGAVGWREHHEPHNKMTICERNEQESLGVNNRCLAPNIHRPSSSSIRLPNGSWV